MIQKCRGWWGSRASGSHPPPATARRATLGHPRPFPGPYGTNTGNFLTTGHPIVSFVYDGQPKGYNFITLHILIPQKTRKRGICFKISTLLLKLHVLQLGCEENKETWLVRSTQSTQSWDGIEVPQDYQKISRHPWRSSGWDSVFPVQGPRVRSLVGELGPRMLHGAAKKKKKISSQQAGKSP